MTVKELKAALNNVENENISVVLYDDQFGRAEIDCVIHQKEERSINSNECVELLVGCEL